MEERKKKSCMKIQPVFLACSRKVVQQSLDQCDSIKVLQTKFASRTENCMDYWK